MKRGRVLLALIGALVFVSPDAGSAQYFGRNKVQYRSFDFDIVRTTHFDIYYYKQERTAVMDAARMAERSYARLSRILQHEFTERKPIILYASHTDFQQTNVLSGLIDEGTGGVTEALKNRVILPFTGSYAEFDHVLTHELVHAFQFDVLLKAPVLNDGGPMGARLPLWFMEGMAEYLSIGRIDPLTVSWLRDATLNGYLRDIRQMSMRDDYLSYRFGQSLWAYIGSKWGDEVVGILLQKAPRMSLERAFAGTLGISLVELSKEWEASVRKAYLPQLADFAQPQTFAQKLTRHDRLGDDWFLSPAISPDGKYLAYLSQRDGFFFDLWLADAKTGKPLRRLVNAARDANFESLRYMTSGAAFSPDGRYLAFAAQTGGRDALYLYDLKKNRVTSKLKFKLDGIESPSYSPDGKHIVFVGLDGGISDLFVTDLKGRLERLTDDRFADLTPAWSPDGKRIAFTTDRGPGTSFERLTYGNYRVALYDLASKDVHVLPQQEHGKNFNPVWAPDAKSLVWVNDATGTNNLALYDLQQQKLYRISDVLSGVLAVKEVSPVLSWARTGRLVFSYFEKAGYNVYAVDDPRKLPRTPMRAPSTPVVAASDAKDKTADAAVTTVARDTLGKEPPAEPVSQRAGVNAEAASASSSARAAGLITSFYRTGSAIRPSAEPVESTEATKPISVMALLDSATLALPDTIGFMHKDYKVKFSADMIGPPSVGTQMGGYYGSGVYGGSYIAFSDMLGNHNILLAGNVNGSISDGSFYTGYSFLKRRANFGVSLQQQPFYRYYGGDYMTLDIDGQPQDVAANVFVRDVIRSATGFISYPLSTFQRIELGMSAVSYKSDVLYRGRYMATGEPLDYSQHIEDMSYLQPMAALVFDNSLFGWTGPIYGTRYRAQYSQTIGNFEFNEALLDFRNYWNFKQSLVFATRLTALTRFGKDSERSLGYWGGPYYIRGYDANSYDLNGQDCLNSRSIGSTLSMSQCPIRDQLIGSSAAFMNVELRVPIIKELQIGLLGSFPPVDLVTFFDGGVAWDQQVCVRTSALDPRRCDGENAQDVHVVWERKNGQDPFLWREPVFSYGAGLRINVFYAVLRLDYAVPLSRSDRSGFRDGIFSLSFGPSF